MYDAAAFGLIQRRIFQKQDQEVFSQIFIDEAQDFGETVYYVLKQVLNDCYFTIMGDVSQNIRYETGMNDWDQLKEAMFEFPERQPSICCKKATATRSRSQILPGKS